MNVCGAGEKVRATFCGLLFALVRPRQMVAEMRRIHLFCSTAGITVSGHVLLSVAIFLWRCTHLVCVCVLAACWVDVDVVALSWEQREERARISEKKIRFAWCLIIFPLTCYDTCIVVLEPASDHLFLTKTRLTRLQEKRICWLRMRYNEDCCKYKILWKKVVKQICKKSRICTYKIYFWRKKWWYPSHKKAVSSTLFRSCFMQFLDFTNSLVLALTIEYFLA